jgi:hypothetical protein
MPNVSPLVRRERAPPAIGNKLGLTENKIIPAIQKRSFPGLESAQNEF